MQIKKRPSILFVSGSLAIGGTEKHLSLILPELMRKGFKISIFVVGEPGELGSKIEDAGIPIYLPLGRSISGIFPSSLQKYIILAVSIFSLIHVLRREKPDILHKFLPLPYLVGGIASFFTKVPIKLMSRRSRNFYMSKYRIAKSLELFLHSRTDLILANSKSVLLDLENEGVRREKIRLLYNGIELSDRQVFVEERLKHRRLLNIADTRVAIIVIANIYKYKGHDEILEALKHLSTEVLNNLTILFVGEDRGYKKSLQEKICKTGENVDIRFVGLVNDVKPYLSSSDIAILASHEEGFSNAILEYMNASLPVIATDVGGNMEAIRHNKSGFIVKVKDSMEIAKRIDNLYHSDALRKNMGEQARADLEKNYSLSKCIENYVRLYDAAYDTYCSKPANRGEKNF